MLILFAGYGEASPPPEFEITFQRGSIAQDDVGLYVDDADLSWKVASVSLRMNVKETED